MIKKGERFVSNDLTVYEVVSDNHVNRSWCVCKVKPLTGKAYMKIVDYSVLKKMEKFD